MPTELPLETGSAPAEAPGALSLPLSVVDIQKLLPHRYPFLLLDRIVEFEPRVRILALKNVTANEPFFAGHFPGYPIMPGVLVLEAMAQAGALMIMHEDARKEERLIFFTGVDACRFRRPVVPGDQVFLDVTVLRFRGNAGRMQGRALIGDKNGALAAEATLSCAVVDRKR